MCIKQTAASAAMALLAIDSRLWTVMPGFAAVRRVQRAADNLAQRLGKQIPLERMRGRRFALLSVVMRSGVPTGRRAGWSAAVAGWLNVEDCGFGAPGRSAKARGRAGGGRGGQIANRRKSWEKKTTRTDHACMRRRRFAELPRVSPRLNKGVADHTRRAWIALRRAAGGSRKIQTSHNRPPN